MDIPNSSQPGSTPKKIFLVDDDEALRKLYETELSLKGYNVITAVDGDDCLQKVSVEKPDLILLDVMMPKKDGIATLKAIKEDISTNKIPVIMLTNFGQEELIKSALEIGAVDYILKYRVTPAEMSEKLNLIFNPPQVEL